MDRDEMFLLKAYLNDEPVDAEKLNKITKKLNLICEQIELQEEFQAKAQEITNKIDELNK